MNRPTFKECMAEALRPVVQKRITEPYERLQRWGQPGGNFGDDQLKPKKATPRVILRLFLSLPVSVVGVALCATIIGIPLGVLILLWVGAFISKPIRKLPAFNVDTTPEKES